MSRLTERLDLMVRPELMDEIQALADESDASRSSVARALLYRGLQALGRSGKEVTASANASPSRAQPAE